MRGARYAVIAGIVMMALGNIFNLQGQSVLGPETSFMYSNPDWISHGTQLAVLGGIVFVAGIVMSVRGRR